jgi:hypothetical protein
MTQGLSLNAGVLLGIAHRAVRRISTADRETDSDMDGLVAILFAAASLEAFINELGALAQNWPASDDPVAASFGTLFNRVEQSRGSPALKFAMAGVAFTGVAYSDAVEPFQSLGLLFGVRNSIVHLQADEFEFDAHGRVATSSYADLQKKVRGKNILAEYDPTKYVNAAPAWVQLLSTRAAARWACTVASQVVGAVLDSIPPSAPQLKGTAEHMYRDDFRPFGHSIAGPPPESDPARGRRVR